MARTDIHLDATRALEALKEHLKAQPARREPADPAVPHPQSPVTDDQGQAGGELAAADEQLLRELTEQARAGGLKLTGEGGLLGKLTKMVVEGALEGELDDHLGAWPGWRPGIGPRGQELQREALTALGRRSREPGRNAPAPLRTGAEPWRMLCLQRHQPTRQSPVMIRALMATTSSGTDEQQRGRR
jgi:hypothetical protein